LAVHGQPKNEQKSVRKTEERGFRDFSRLLSAKENRASRQTQNLPNQTPLSTAKGTFMANELDGSNRNKEMERILLSVINTLQDSQKGFADIGEHLKDESLKRYFLAESLKRANFRAELENELHRAGMHDVKDSGTVSGALHRTWGDIKSKLGGGDHTLLETAEQGEDEAKKAYKDALDQELPLPIRQLLAEQQSHVLSSHDFVRNHRDALAAR
jgi:uncharacterized protein (TIGR02284 family)